MNRGYAGLNHDCAGAVSFPDSSTWTSLDSVIYARGVGAGPDQLAFAADDTRGVEPRALPMAVVLAKPGDDVANAMGDFDRSKLVHGSCDGDVERFRAMSARFVASVYPGTRSAWRCGLDDDATVFAGYRDGDKPVITGGFGGQFI